MIRNFLYELKISKLSYLLEVIRTRDIKKKIKAFNKICKMKLTDDMGMMILSEIEKCNLTENENFDIYYSLLLFLVGKPRECYYESIKNLFPNLENDNKYEILNILSLNDSIPAVSIYANLVSEYYDGSYDLPIGVLSSNDHNFIFLYPKFYELLKKDIKLNKTVALLSDYLNSGLCTEKEIKKNKKYIENAIINIFKEALNYKLKDNYMLDNNYFNLRLLLEAAVNVEYYISSRKTSTYLTKLLKRKDNQIKLFILENYVKKGKDISKISLTPIAKDLLSRYPLYNFLKFYNIEKLFPKKYLNDELLGESDLAINYAVKYAYTDVPTNIKYLESRVIGDYKFNFYSFNTKYNYREEVNDPATDYILKAANLDKKLTENAITPFIGVSGGFNKDINPSLIEYTLPSFTYEKFNKDSKDIINSLESRIKKYLKKTTDKDINEDNVVINEETKRVLEQKGSIKRALKRIFSFNTIFSLVSITLVFLIVILFLYINGYDVLNLSGGRFGISKEDAIVASTMKNENFKEISYRDLFNQPESEYYVLIFKKKEISIYYSLIDTLLKNQYPIYYIDLRNEENNPIYGNNETGFTISDETFIKVNNREYEFYIIGKPYIIKELKDYTDYIKLKNQEKLEAEKKAMEEEKKKKEAEEKEKQENSENEDNNEEQNND